MDEILRRLAQDGGSGSGVFDAATVVLSMAVALVFSLLLAYVYRVTHQGISYSVSFVHTMVLMSMTTAVIMLIIGSNIARAFSLVGALSIIRFRNAVKDTRDVGFIFMAMAVGMAAGTGFYLVACIFTLFACMTVYLLSRFEVGAVKLKEMLLKVHVPEKGEHQAQLGVVLVDLLKEHSLLSVESLGDTELLELVYSVQPRKGVSDEALIRAAREAGAQHVTLLTGRSHVAV